MMGNFSQLYLVLMLNIHNISKMNVGTSSKKSLKTKHTIDQTYSSQSRLNHAKSQQYLLDKTVDESKIEQFLIKQIEAARMIIQSYPPIQSQTLPKIPPANRQDCIKSLYEMERQIEVKNQQINYIGQQIKDLKSYQKQTYNEGLKSYKTIRNLLFFKLSDQIGQQKDELIGLQKQHKRKKEEVEKGRKFMIETIQAYSSILNQDTKRLISYEEFAKNKKSRNKYDAGLKNKKILKKQIGMTKESIQIEQNNKKCNILNSTDLKEVENKKLIAQSALKILKKKHYAQIQQLNGKLQFLQEQNEELQIKLKQKIEQLKSAEDRFSQAKEAPNKKTIKPNRYSEPQL